MVRSPRRSKLVVFTHRPEGFAAAANSDSDIIQCNLYDGVQGIAPGASREAAAARLDMLRRPGREVWVKVSPFHTGLTEDDVAAFRDCQPDAIVLGEVQSLQELVMLDDSLSKLYGRQHGAGLVAVIESMHGLAAVEEIARATPRLTSLAMGPKDLGRDIGYILDRVGPSFETLYAKSRSILAARLAGIDIGDAPYPYTTDLAGTIRSTLWSLQLGFTTKAALSPEQIPVIHQAFALSDVSGVRA
jgi:citrate lyase beta subunit